MNIWEKYAKLRVLYPNDIKRIEEEEQRIKELLENEEYSQLESTKRLLAFCRTDIIFARKKLATERALDEKARDGLWFIIEAREWVLKHISGDFKAEIEQVERELERELNP